MTNQRNWGPAMRRYNLRMAVLMVLYVAVLFSVAWLHRHGPFPHGAGKYLVAAAPALPVFGVIWAMLRFVDEEEDEYLRLLHTRAHILATGFTLAICTAWGFLETYADAPRYSMYWVFVLFCLLLCPAQMWVKWRASQ